VKEEVEVEDFQKVDEKIGRVVAFIMTYLLLALVPISILAHGRYWIW